MNDSVLSRNCPICTGEDIRVILDAGTLPVLSNSFASSRAAALDVPMGQVRLVLCSSCGYVFNLDFDPRSVDYSSGYENSLHCSPTFQNYARNLARELVSRHNLNGKTVVEIGCGRGEFLMLLCEEGAARGIGFDPGLAEEQGIKDDRIRLINTACSDNADVPGDFFCMRHVLEHLHEPRLFLKALCGVQEAGRGETPVYIEVPNGGFMLRQGAIWDIIHEHCGYHTPSSLSRLLIESGLILDALNEQFNGQYLCAHAHLSDKVAGKGVDTEEFASSLEREAIAFAGKYLRQVEKWRETLGGYAAAGRRVVVWGAGSKGVSFLNMVHPADHGVECVVDINPRKQGLHIPGTGQQIFSPSVLATYRPHVILLMNRVYGAEIGAMLGEMGIACQLEYVEG